MDDDYRFLPIVDAISAINQKVNLVGVVLETSIHPPQFKGTDCFCTVKIIDESYSSPGLLVNCFGENMEKLPSVHSAGDIILFSRVMIKSHCGDVNAVFNKKFSSFAIFEGKHGTQFLPYQASANFHPRDEDNKFLDCLRKWKENEIEKLPPLQLELFPLPRDVLLKFPTIDIILKVVMENENQGLQLLNCEMGEIDKCKCEQHVGHWRCMLMPSVSVRHRKLISESQRNYEKRLTLKRRREPFSGHLPPSSIMEMDKNDPRGCNCQNPCIFICRKFEVFFSRVILLDESLKTTRNALLGVMTPSGRSNEEQQCVRRKPPWVQFCLKSYYTDKNDKWGTNKGNLSLLKREASGQKIALDVVLRY
ncbi:protection of telomeres protein 1a-like [Impatiens glandulifera]|uniref:protection of telomeres protein 1a-like n=1 Tax=Impatiens glandulifera TaxID=253017 RepID=UPI001FB0E309|nr:protection of telomeres protein 1a-like [Impatiens glandulifera]